MRYLSGAVYKPCMEWTRGGVMLTPNMGNNPNLSCVSWAADNGCFSQSENFSELKWLHFLEKHKKDTNTCLFAVAPDVPFDMKKTWERSKKFLPIIRDLGYKAALAIQEGADIKKLEWDTFDAVFIAGSKNFKTSWIAYQVAREAKKRKKHVHVARRNSRKATQEAYDLGADSIDGTFLCYAPDKNFILLQSWFSHLCIHQSVSMWDLQYGICQTCKRQVFIDL